MMSDPFDEQFGVDVRDGALHVARAGPPPDSTEGIVLAVHGVTASLMTWRTVARKLAASSHTTLLAPDLRGRGSSAKLPGPFGISVHIDDLIAVLDHSGARQAVVVGHSMGAYVAARLAVEHPERVAGLVLLDAGLPLPDPEDPDEMVRTAVQNAVMRLAITFPSVDEYVDAWRRHPAFAHSWSDDVDAYARYDLVDEDHTVRCVASPSAVRTDSVEMVLDGTTRTALDRVRAQDRVQVLRAERGLFDDKDEPLIPIDELRAFSAKHPEARIEEVANVNHYTLVMGESPGPDRVVDAIRSACATPDGRASGHPFGSADSRAPERPDRRD
jgi:lipase